MGISIDIRYVGVVKQYSTYEDGSIENQILTVYTAIYDGDINIDNFEVVDFVKMSLEEAKEDIKKHPENYANGLRLTFPLIYKLYKD